MIKVVKELGSEKKEVFTLKDSVNPENLHKIAELLHKTLTSKKTISEGKITASVWTEKRVKRGKIVDVLFIKFTKLTWNGDECIPTDRFNIVDLPAIADLANRLTNIEDV